MPKLRLQEPQQADLQISLGREIGVSALTGENMMPRTVPEQPRFPEPGSRSDYSLIADRRPTDLVRRNEVCRCQRGHAPCTCLQIVDQKCGRQMNLLGEPRLLDDPRQVRGLDSPVAHWSSDSEASSIRTCS